MADGRGARRAAGPPLRASNRLATVLTWGGLRGGISVALALSLPAEADRDILLSLTYGVVVFSILVQGLTVGRVARTAMRHGRGPRRLSRSD